jgi:hypothetical protein
MASLESQLQEEIRFLISENLELREKAEHAQHEFHALQDEFQTLQETHRTIVESERKLHVATLAPASSGSFVAPGSDSLTVISATNVTVSSSGPAAHAVTSSSRPAVLGILQLGENDVPLLVRDLFLQADHNILMVISLR